MRTRPLRAACLVLASLVTLVGPPGATELGTGHPQSVTGRAPEGATETPVPEGPVRPPLPPADPVLSALIDQVVGDSPADTCISVSIDGVPLYRHDGDLALIPASNQKLLTAAAALDLLGPDHRFRTSLVAAAPPADGVIAGDLTIVGGGDPNLVTAPYATFMGIGADRPSTSLEGLVGQLKAAGVTRVAGRVVGDEQRYDRVRQVPSWPENYLGERQSGNLSALGVDDGYDLVRDGDRVVDRVRADDPALHTARLFTAFARFSGITIDGEAASGSAPVGAVEVTGVDSAPLGEIVSDLVRTSDNQVSELLLKELGRTHGGAGSTPAGAAVVTQWAAERKLSGPGSVVVDGSGLDRGNRVTCDELVALLDAVGGADSAIGVGLPVAGRTGTLAGRFAGTAAAGKLRAKTGRLNPVSSLAGFVDLPEGRQATFAYIANAEFVGPDVLHQQERLGIILAQYLAPCPSVPSVPVVAPAGATSAALGAISAVPAAAAALPGALATLDAIEGQLALVADRCLAADPAAVADLVP